MNGNGACSQLAFNNGHRCHGPLNVLRCVLSVTVTAHHIIFVFVKPFMPCGCGWGRPGRDHSYQN